MEKTRDLKEALKKLVNKDFYSKQRILDEGVRGFEGFQEELAILKKEEYEEEEYSAARCIIKTEYRRKTAIPFMDEYKVVIMIPR
jgi:hypothetical protein